MVFWMVVIAFVWAPSGQRYPAALLSAFTFALVLSWRPACRPRTATPLCPWNWALLVFFVQLTGMPLLITLLGPEPGQLPELPSAFAINLAMVVNSVAFVAFAWVFSSYAAGSEPEGSAMTSRLQGRFANRRAIPNKVIGAFAILGIIGVFLTFGNLGVLREYFNNPIGYVENLFDLNSTWRGFGGVLFKPFLGFAVIMAWCKWLDHGGKERPWWQRSAVALIVILAVVFSYSMFTYNRGSIAVPLVGLAAIVFAQRDKATVRLMALLGVLFLAVMPLYEAYRGAKVLGEDLLQDRDSWDPIISQLNLSNKVQVYGAAPQYLGFLLERSHWGRTPHWGGATISSILSPVPILGKPFRASSGASIYNNFIYGNPEMHDQIVPFQGETFLDFHIFGVIAGYSFLGWIAFRLQRAFDRSKSFLEVFMWQYLSVWTFFLIFGSISVVSMVYIYFLGPFFAYFLLTRRRPAGVLAEQSAVS
jgi:hypothetical protein